MLPPKRSPVRWRSLCWTAHRWLGIALAIVLVPVAVSGSLLVWHDTIDAMLNPGRYAVSGPQVSQPASVYLARAAEALPPGMNAVALRYPEEEGFPVTVMGRAAPREGAPASFRRVYLDPPTGHALDVMDARNSFVGVLHRFHENLTIPEWSGRQVVGWVGVAMLMLSLSGIWLWWPRNGAFVPGLRWRRVPAAIGNLHFLVGFWISIPLAVVSFTGIYLGFPQSARSVMSTIAPMNPQGARPGFGEAVRQPLLGIDAALAKALELAPDARPAAIFLPTIAARPNEGASRANGPSREGGAVEGRRPSERAAPPEWRVQLRSGNEVWMVMVDDLSGRVRRLPDPLAGDRAAQWMRWIHEGSHAGSLWQIIVFLTGVAPPALALTGLIMWLRGRRTRDAKTVASTVASPLASPVAAAPAGAPAPNAVLQK